MANVTFTHGTTTHRNHLDESKKIVTAFVNGSYEDTMIMDASATDEDAMRLYNQRLIAVLAVAAFFGWMEHVETMAGCLK